KCRCSGERPSRGTVPGNLQVHAVLTAKVKHGESEAYAHSRAFMGMEPRASWRMAMQRIVGCSRPSGGCSGRLTRCKTRPAGGACDEPLPALARLLAAGDLRLLAV